MAAKGRELQEGELGAKMKKFLESPNDERMKQHLTNYGVAVLLETLKDDLICRQYDNCEYYWSTEGKKAVSGQVGFEAAALFVLDEIGAAELARRHKQAQPQPSMARFEARAKAAVSKVQDAADLASRKARKAERERKALESNLAERLLDEYVERRFGPDCAEGKAKEAEGAVEDDEGGGQSSGDQSGAGQSGADESSGASDEAAGGGAAALKAGAPSSAYAVPIERPPQPDPRDPSPFRVVALPSLAEAEAALAAAEASTSAALADPAEIGDAGPLEQQQEPRQQRDEDEGQANAAAEADDKRREAEERAEKAEERAVKAEARAGDAVAAAEAASEAEAKAKAEAKELAAQLEAERVVQQQAHPRPSSYTPLPLPPPRSPAPPLTSGAPRHLPESKLRVAESNSQLEQVCAEADCRAPLTPPYKPYTPLPQRKAGGSLRGGRARSSLYTPYIPCIPFTLGTSPYIPMHPIRPLHPHAPSL